MVSGLTVMILIRLEFFPSAVQLKGSSLPVVQLLSHVQLPVDPMDRSPPDSFVHGISQARIIE